MKGQLKILLLEDLPEDADLISRTLKKNELNFKLLIVDNKTDFVREITDFDPHYRNIQALKRCTMY